ncbi:Acetamidase, partial [Grifola frondosa]
QWEEAVADKRKRQLESIPKEWLIPPVPKEQTNVMKRSGDHQYPDVSVLLQKLASSEWSAVEVTTAFCKRAVIAHQLASRDDTNCLTEIFVEKALQRAAELDEYLKQHGTVIGPLHGLPVSLKDQFQIKGLETTMGYAAWIGAYATDDAVLVKLLLQCGAVLYVRTNVPQTLMWGETYNNVFGRCVNPFNTSLTPGGSSGGEGALIAQHGSLLGVGSDIGGSIRVPSHFCGIYGFKPSSHRMPSFGIVNSLDGQESVSTSLGPLSVSLSGIKILTQAILEQQPWRHCPNTVSIPWSQDAYTLKEHNNGRNLCFGIMWDEGTVKPHPPIARALELTKRALESAGHQVIEWKGLRSTEFVAIARSFFLADGGADYKASLTTGEPLINNLAPDADPLDIPAFRQPREPLSAYQVWQLNKEMRQLRKAHLDYWESTVSATGTGRPVDALICPVAPYAAVPHGKTRSSIYTIIWNALDYPSLVIPVTTVDPALDVKSSRDEFLSSEDEILYDMYDPEVYKGMPVGIQLVGQTLQEEVVLGIGEIVDGALKST